MLKSIIVVLISVVSFVFCFNAEIEGHNNKFYNIIYYSEVNGTEAMTEEELESCEHATVLQLSILQYMAATGVLGGTAAFICLSLAWREAKAKAKAKFAFDLKKAFLDHEKVWDANEAEAKWQAAVAKEFAACRAQLQKPDMLFNNMILAHGVGAFAGSSIETMKKNIDRLINIDKDAEICCAHKSQKIGKVGVFLRGTNVAVFNRDVYSYMYHGKRYCESWKINSNLVTDITKYSLREWNHTEHWVCDLSLVAAWIKQDYVATEEGQEMLSFLNERFERVYIVKED